MRAPLPDGGARRAPTRLGVFRESFGTGVRYQVLWRTGRQVEDRGIGGEKFGSRPVRAVPDPHASRAPPGRQLPVLSLILLILPLLMRQCARAHRPLYPLPRWPLDLLDAACRAAAPLRPPPRAARTRSQRPPFPCLSSILDLTCSTCSGTLTLPRPTGEGEGRAASRF